MQIKMTTLEDALELVQSGDTLGLGGMTLYRRPLAFVRALIQQQRPLHDLTLLALTCGLESDLLVGAGLVSQIRTCYFGLESFGLAPMFTTAVADGTLNVIEESEASIANGLRAQLAGVGFMPSQAWQGTEMFTVRPDVQTITDPYTGKSLTAFPAIPCNTAIIHVLRADKAGNCLLGGNPTVDFELAAVADRVIITTEELVEQLPAPIDIPGFLVTAVVHMPGGARPTSCYPLYPLDGMEILRYIELCHAGEFDS